MIDYYLRFTDQTEALTVMSAFTYTDDVGNTYLSQGGHQYALWEVGQIPNKDGWHVNLRVVDPTLDLSSVEPFRVYPDHPFCVWA